MNSCVQYCLYGDDPKYTRGVANAIWCQEHYPGMTCVWNVDDTVPTQVIDWLRRQPNVEIIDRTSLGFRDGQKMLWRFLALDPREGEWDVLLSRDADSRIYDRESHEVRKWIQDDSSEPVLALHDSGSHSVLLMGGMVGFKIQWPGIADDIIKYCRCTPNRPANGWDQDWLYQRIQPIVDEVRCYGNVDQETGLTYDLPITRYHVGAPDGPTAEECEKWGITW
jgi:hypothetical protein